jgi:nicotinamidase-related amidase
MPVPRIFRENSVLLVVDVQYRLLAKIPTAPELVRNVVFLLDAAALLGVPAIGTEQYPKGLGPTTPEVAKRLPTPIAAKTAFSCCGAANFLSDLQAMRREQIVLVGMEAHVCVAQTAMDLLDAGFQVFLPIDALASRFAIDHEVAVRRLERAGAVATTSEAAAFEWVGDAARPQFKAISKLVIARAEG